MTLPNRRSDLEAFGYTKLPDKQPGGAHCTSCNAPIEWWLTRKFKKMPFEARTEYVDGVPVEYLIPHFGNCPKWRPRSA
jgi:hypothetical protein